MAAKTRGVVQKTEALLSRFQGSLVAAVTGDCLGAHFEMALIVNVKQVVDFFARLHSSQDSPELTGGDTAKETNGHLTKKKFPHVFTDDTAMARSVAASLIQLHKVDAVDLANRFVKEYGREPWRGYGSNVGKVFKELKAENCREPHGPAAQQFNGSGSFGNGGAMRVVPAALYGYNLSTEELNHAVEDITKVTHTHIDAINGAKLQCAAVRAALRLEPPRGTPPCGLDTDAFLATLRTIMASLEDQPRADLNLDSPQVKRPKGKSFDDSHPYCKKLDLIEKYLKSPSEPSRLELEETLGNDISALGSVPAAIYSFLRSSRPIPDVPVDNPLERTVIFAVTLGGDTDTIATMAGAIAGAYYGIELVPRHWQETCEGVTEAIEQATQLHRHVFVGSSLSETQVEPKDTPALGPEESGRGTDREEKTT